MRENGIKINPDKSIKQTPRLDWLGYKISKEVIRPCVNKTQEIALLEVSGNIKATRALMGKINYYARFVKDLAHLAAPIYALLKKHTKFVWTDKQQDALNRIKGCILERPILTPFNTDGKLKVVLKCDACQDGMGAVLEQESDTGDLRPVLFWSSKFRKYEANHYISEKEALACVFAMTKLKKYLLGRHFLLQIDHKALESLLSQKLNKRAMARET